MALLGQVSIEPVFTAHPTESTRRTLLRQQQRIARLLLDGLDPSRTPAERRAMRRARAHGTHDRLADRRQLPRAADRGGRARARAVLHRRGDLRGHPGLLRGGRGGAGQGLRRRGRRDRSVPEMLQFRLVGRRRHGRPPGRARQDDSRELQPSPPADRQPVLPRGAGAGREAEPEREPRRGVARDQRPDRGLPEPGAGRAGVRRRPATTGCRTACCSGRSRSACGRPTTAVPASTIASSN